MGEISECSVIIPSRGRSGGGRTIFASTCAMTLQQCVNKCCAPRISFSYLVSPNAHSTHPSSGPKDIVTFRSSKGFRPSKRKDCLSESYKNSFSGIEGEGGLIGEDGVTNMSRCDVAVTI
jgi:hypothetical protein